MSKVWILFLFVHVAIWGQTPDSATPEAPVQVSVPLQKKAQNLTAQAGKALKPGNCVQSEADWRRAMAIDPSQKDAPYNLGNTLLSNNSYEEAISALVQATKTAETADQKHQAYHNLGNALMAQKAYDRA